MQSMEEVYRSHAKTVYKYLLVKCQNEDLAEELTQETFYQAIKSIDRYDKSCKMSTWLCAIAKNKYLEYVRKHKAIDSIEDDNVKIDEPISSAEDACITSASRVELMRKLHSCQEPYREVLYLRIFGNLSFKEIGEIMNQSENWARVTFYRGKEKLRKEVEYHEE